jgi:hypothetical protein
MKREETRGNVRNRLSRDLKSLDGNVVWVRVPPPAPIGRQLGMFVAGSRSGEAMSLPGTLLNSGSLKKKPMCGCVES